MTRSVEIYVLWNDRTWSIEAVELHGPEAQLGDDEAAELAREVLQAKLECHPRFEAVGPVFHLGE